MNLIFCSWFWNETSLLAHLNFFLRRNFFLYFSGKIENTDKIVICIVWWKSIENDDRTHIFWHLKVSLRNTSTMSTKNSNEMKQWLHLHLIFLINFIFEWVYWLLFAANAIFVFHVYKDIKCVFNVEYKKKKYDKLSNSWKIFTKQ